MDTLALGCTLPAIGRVTDLHRLENARAGRTPRCGLPNPQARKGFRMPTYQPDAYTEDLFLRNPDILLRGITKPTRQKRDIEIFRRKISV